jgi:hypothetical protein
MPGLVRTRSSHPLLDPPESPAAPHPRAGGEPCERCGSLDAVEIAGRHLCDECCSVYGSCCLEFGADDLWSKDDVRDD